MLNLGCGPNWQEQYPNHEGLDITNYGQIYYCDVLDFFKDGTNAPEPDIYDEVIAYHFMEHFNQDDLKLIFSGVYKILKLGGIFKIIVPHMKKERSWVLTHKTFWNEAMIKWLQEPDASIVYGFGRWSILELVTNDREDIYAELKKI